MKLELNLFRVVGAVLYWEKFEQVVAIAVLIALWWGLQ